MSDWPRSQERASSPNLSQPRGSRVALSRQQQELKVTVHKGLIQRLDLERLSEVQDTRLGQQQLLSTVHQLLTEQEVPLSTAERSALAQEVLDEVFGLGPLQPLLNDATVSDILVNTASAVYVERRGVLERTEVVFQDNQHLLRIIEKMVSAVGRRIDESSPMVDCRLLDGSRVNVIIPPLAVDGPILSIRRFGRTPLGPEDLLRTKMLTEPMLQLLAAGVKARLNIVVSGGTGAGKTTLLNVLSSFISPRERIVTIEDSAELQVRQEHVVKLETRPPNVEGKGAIRQRELLINALRMRPDRIVVGEVRGEEALDMLQAMNTGHDGSITTVHANTPRDAVSRLEVMALMGDVRVSEKAVRAQIASAVQMIVQVTRLSDGTRRVSHITELTGSTGDIVHLQDVVLLEKRGLTHTQQVRGRFAATGVVPHFGGKLLAAGVSLPDGLGQHVCEI